MIEEQQNKIINLIDREKCIPEKLLLKLQK